MVTIEAPAKINLCLAVKGKDGKLHRLDGVFCPVPFLKDAIRLEKATDVTVAYADGQRYENDTARRMAEAIFDRYGVGAKIFIDKGIPEGAGLGGSSVDAGAVARGMQSLYGLPEIDTDLLLSVGSDVPYCYAGGVKRVRGFGEETESVSFPPLYAAILVPTTGVDTAKCYALFDEIGGEDGDVDAFIKKAQQGTIRPFNALRRASERLNEDVRRGIRILEEVGLTAGLSGSGSATFGLDTDRENFEKKLSILRERAKGFTLYAPPRS